MSESLINRIDWDDLRENLRPVLFPENNRIIKQSRTGEIEGKIIGDFDLDLIWPDKELRKNWISLISSNPIFSDCIKASAMLLQGKRNEQWLKKYHDLYFNLKENGYSEEYFPVVGIHIGADSYYRLDGTHRCSSLLDLGYERIRVLIIELEDVMEIIPQVREQYENYILDNFPDYQGFEGAQFPQNHERYQNLLSITEEYISGKSVADIGCNAGYLSILLSQSGCSHVHGLDISELDIEAARVYARRKNLSHDKLQFHLGLADENMKILRECDVLFFIRSIYHLGRGASTILEGLGPGTIVVVECNRGQIVKIKDPEKVIPTVGKRLALVENLIPYLKNKGFTIIEKTKNVDDVVIAVKEQYSR